MQPFAKSGVKRRGRVRSAKILIVSAFISGFFFYSAMICYCDEKKDTSLDFDSEKPLEIVEKEMPSIKRTIIKEPEVLI